MLSYLSSNKQKLNKKNIKKLPAWSLFAMCILLATYCFTYRYGLVVAALNSVLLIMTMWLLLVIVSSHINHKLMLVGTLGISLFSGVILLGIR
ncbi:hypothetical protein EGC77_05455 [Shewanella psychromarinicola]|uniref:Uncharacterized protein n=1 Tax=Shewanella psychromarinicola TaxID=2487742 RepID=A0A3N4EFU2_9GAMM|nr:hypothetical protein EGC77_05455 [Shewanella psychromarinicola]